VKELIAENIDLNILSYNIRHMDNGKTPLFFACWYNRLDTVNLLITEKVDLNKSNDETPFWIACQKNYIEIVKILISANVDMEHSDKWRKKTPWEATSDIEIKNIIVFARRIFQTKETIANRFLIQGSRRLDDEYLRAWWCWTSKE
jgi:ankyrin repeat protein